MKTTFMPITGEELLKPLVGMRPTDLLLVDADFDDKNNDCFELQVTSVAGSGVMPSAAARAEFIARFPEHKERMGGVKHAVPMTDVSAMIISKLWKPEQVRFTPEAQTVYDYLNVSLYQQQWTTQLSASYHDHVKSRGTIRALGIPTQPIVRDFDLKDDYRMMLHQRTAAANSLHNDAYALFMEQGTGKTLSVIARVDEEVKQFWAEQRRLMAEDKEFTPRMWRTLIVAPKNVRANWQREFERFSTSKGRVVVLRGGAIDRIKGVLEAMVPRSNQEHVVIVISYECLHLSWDILGKIEWDLSVLDESHMIKWPRTKRAVFAMKLRDMSKNRMCLTGTPVCNTPVDLYSQLEFLRKGGSGFSSFEAFRSFYGVFRSDVDGRKRLVDVQNLPFMRERLARMSFVVRKEEALPDLPDKTYDVVEVEMTPEQAEAYKTIQHNLFIEIQRESEKREMNANNILTRLLRLAQITSGFLTFDPIVDLDTGEQLAPKVVDRFDPNAKIEALIRILKGVRSKEGGWEQEPLPLDEKCLIWACWVQDIRTLSARLTEEGIGHVTFFGGTSEKDRQIAESRFNNDPTCRVFLANPAAGGTGLNLVGYDYWNTTPTQVTDTTMEIFLSQDWSSPKRSQAEDRACRRGQRRPVRIIDLCVANTIDEEIRARVTNKRLMAHEVQNLTEILERVLGRKVLT